MKTKRRARSRLPTITICAGLVAITWMVFGQTLRHDFVNYDDRTYVYGNPQVSRGLSISGVAWAFTHSHARNWHPLTTISHMLDCQLYGLKPSGHHFTNVVIHSLTVVLLFLILQNLTGYVWRSAFIAAVFAVHPLRVESVAWVAERKDVLSALFFVLVLGAYVRYTRRLTPAANVLTLILFALGLMSKPMLVTVPFVLLLVDYWPLQRMVDKSSFWRCLAEKIPFFVLSLGSCIATILAARDTTGAMEALPLVWRIENAMVSYALYVWEIVWPADLAVFYPYPTLRIWTVLLALAGLIAITIVAIVRRKSHPYILVGWLWYLGMLVPVIGFWQIGLQGHADRYTYLPHIGLYLAIVWGIAEAPILRDYPRVLGGLAVPIVIIFAWLAWIQTVHWQNSETLWRCALAVTSNNDVAHNNLGLFYVGRGELDEGITHYKEALKIRSADTVVHYDLSTALVHNNLANALTAKGRVAEAVTHYRQALDLRPDYADGHYNLGRALFGQGRTDDAIAEWNAALSLQPNDADVHTNLGNALLQKGQVRQAAEHYDKAINAVAPSVEALNNLAWILCVSNDSSFRDPGRALELAERAVRLGGANPVFLRTLAAAYAENGRFAEAIKTSERAGELARSQNDQALANEIETEIDLYRQNITQRNR